MADQFGAADERDDVAGGLWRAGGHGGRPDERGDQEGGDYQRKRDLTTHGHLPRVAGDDRSASL
jgi:hypothetical protein